MINKLNKKLKEISVLKILLAIIFSTSFSCLSIQLMTLKNENLLIILTTIISFSCGLFLFLHTFNYIKILHNTHRRIDDRTQRVIMQGRPCMPFV